jgi:hypothetical protein
MNDRKDSQGAEHSASRRSEGQSQTGWFRKLPVAVQAYLFHNRLGPDDRPNWIIEAQRNGHLIFYGPQDGPPHLMIQTLEGDMRADPGDWIICGVAGELYPCKADIFDATYEPVNETPEGEHVGGGLTAPATAWRCRASGAIFASTNGKIIAGTCPIHDGSCPMEPL